MTAHGNQPKTFWWLLSQSVVSWSTMKNTQVCILKLQIYCKLAILFDIWAVISFRMYACIDAFNKRYPGAFWNNSLDMIMRNKLKIRLSVTIFCVAYLRLHYTKYVWYDNKWQFSLSLILIIEISIVRIILTLASVLMNVCIFLRTNVLLWVKASIYKEKIILQTLENRKK